MYSGALAVEGSDAFVLKPSQPPSIETEMILIRGEIFKNRTGTFILYPTLDLPWLSARHFTSLSCCFPSHRLPALFVQEPKTENYLFSCGCRRSYAKSSVEKSVKHLLQMYTYLWSAKQFPVPWGTNPRTVGMASGLGPWTSRGLPGKTLGHCKRGPCPLLEGTEQKKKLGLSHGESFVPAPTTDQWDGCYIFCLWQGLCLSWCCPTLKKY